MCQRYAFHLLFPFSFCHCRMWFALSMLPSSITSHCKFTIFQFFPR